MLWLLGHNATASAIGLPVGRPGRLAYNRPMLATLGKWLQIAGLITLPLAMVMQVTGGIRADTGQGFSVSAMLLLMVFGVILFALGRLIEGYAAPR